MSSPTTLGPEAVETSPFSSAIIEVGVHAGTKLTTLFVHRALVEAHPKLLGTILSSHFRGKAQSGLQLAEPRRPATIDIGHILIKWLYSGTYQLLPQEVKPSPGAALKTAFGVYCLARTYNLPGLETLAKEQISLLGAQVDLFTLTDVVSEAYPHTIGDDAWVHEYLSSRTRTALDDDLQSPVMPDGPVEPEEGMLVAKTILRGVVVAYREKSEELTAREAALEEATRALATQQTAFDNAVKSAKGDDHHSDYELAPEKVPEFFALAAVKQLALSPTAAASPEPDWVVTSPQLTEKVDDEPVISMKVKASKKDKKKRPKKREPEPEPTEDELKFEPKPESDPVAELVVEGDRDPWATWGLVRKSSKGNGERPPLWDDRG